MTDQASGIRRKLITIFCADVQGYSALVERDEVGTVTRLKQYREIMVDLIGRHHGRLINTWGDGLVAEFGSPVEAVFCAVETQRRLATRNAEDPAMPPMWFRIGINLGDVMIEGSDIYGEGVNIAARLESLAEPGGICISGTVFEQVRKKLDIGFDFLGDREIKNIAEPVAAYRVQISPGIARPAPVQMPGSGLESDADAAIAKWRGQAWKLGVLAAFLLIVNLLTSPGRMWFYWPLLGFAFFLLMRWPSGVDPRRLWQSRQ
ncbi:MAG: adenylate/guanylate cyclase domain-containing protein [Ferrovibrio sp.]|uniref:adenylate/guanylate cyclase domain-containing protein n=1 Tax=Ferrovibrio sp. TaxID=1917215 RepID=UPI002621F2C9|nr:adenylate/guanylate cyclase domain-containing protein [Ferrovibrio sp.]MCW0234827.1 adenylate/guanylate cyclase domain-containing protein [Ferrovibrio sp.]